MEQFLKPDKRKIFLSIVLLILGSIVFLNVNWLPDNIYELLFVRTWWFRVILSPISCILCEFSSQCILCFLIILFSIIFWYLIACLIIWIYDKFKKKSSQTRLYNHPIAQPEKIRQDGFSVKWGSMKIARIISFIAFISNIYLSVRSYGIFLNARRIFIDLQIPTTFPWPLFLDLIFTVGAVVYWFYLGKKEKRGEKVTFALLISISLFIIPFLITFLMPGFIYFNPIYEYLGEINL